jgi:hypothetical protein
MAPISEIQSFRIDTESDADEYLDELLRDSKYRSMDEIEGRAQTLIKDEKIRDYFVERGKEKLKTAIR